MCIIAIMMVVYFLPSVFAAQVVAKSDANDGYHSHH